MRLRLGIGSVAIACSAAVLAFSTPPEQPRPAVDDLEVVVERTELRWSRTGRLLGHLRRGMALERLGGRDGWTRVGVRGWMWRPSLTPVGDQFRISPARENLRASPNGSILGTLVRGVEVRRVATRGRWYEIEMIGWLPDAAVRAIEREVDEEPETGDPDEEEATPPPVAVSPPSPSAASARVGEPVTLRVTPDGDAVAALPEGQRLEALETRGGWTRVRVEGWVPEGSIAKGTDGVPSAMTPSAVGRRVTWTVEHIALQSADEWRTEFEPGERYDLARSPDDPSRYVYLVVPDRLIDRFESLAPFAKIRIRGVVRSDRSELTGAPIVVVEEVLS